MGGIQRHSFNLVRHLARLGVDIDLYHTDFGGSEGIGDLAGIEEDLRPWITSIPLAWPKRARLPGHFVRELGLFSESIFAMMRTRGPVDLVYDQGMTAGAIVAARRHDLSLPPVLSSIHGFEMFQRADSPRTFLSNLLTKGAYGAHVRASDAVVSLGGRLTELIHRKVRVPMDRIIELPNGIDSSWFSSPPEVPPTGTPVRFLFVGRYVRLKGIEELQRAILMNPSWAGRAHFRFIGPIPEDKRLDLRHVSYAGAIHDEERLREEYRMCDVLLCPSHSEGMPTVILEAMATGMAVIASDVGATNTMVSATNGILLPRSTPQTIAAAVERMLALADAELMAMKRSSLENVQAFRWDQVAAKTLEAMQTVVQDCR